MKKKIKICLMVFAAAWILGLGFGTRQIHAEMRPTRAHGIKSHGKLINFRTYLPWIYRDTYRVLQGCGTDGTYNYMLFKHKKDPYCVMLKVNARTWRKVKVSKPLPLDHGNDVAYNPHTKKLYVVYWDKAPFRIAEINPKTLKIRRYITIQMPLELEGIAPERIPEVAGIVGIAYSKKLKQYAVRVSGLNDFIVLDANFTPIRYVPVSKTYDIRRQGIDCDGQYVYVAMNYEDRYNIIMVYDWNGKYQYHVKIFRKYEIQSIFHRGKTFYAGMYYNSKKNRYGIYYRLGRPRAKK